MTVCLTMIVRDEAETVARAIASAAPSCTYALICDTGSTDGTQKIVCDTLDELDLMGHVEDHAWVDFGTNRTRALEAAQGYADHLLMLDADDLIAGELGDLSDVVMGELECHQGTIRYWRPHVFRAGLPWRYEGVTHEYATIDHPVSHTRIETARYIVGEPDGGKFPRDIRLLEARLAEHPDDTRAVFYLAQSYYDAGDHASAELYYRRRAGMSAWDEEVFYSLHRMGICAEYLRRSREEVEAAYLRAWRSRPTRAEPLRELARFWFACGRTDAALLAARHANTLERPDDVLFVDAAAYLEAP